MKNTLKQDALYTKMMTTIEKKDNAQELREDKKKLAR